MSEKPISPLRQRMIEDMSVRGLTENTRGDYVRNVRAFAVFISRSPDTATAEDPAPARGCPPGPAPVVRSAPGQSQNAPRSAKNHSRAHVP